MAKKKFTTNIDEELLDKIKIKAIKEKKNVNKTLEELLKKYLEGDEGMLNTNFNKDSIRILCNESGGNVEYSYNYFKGGFEEWADELDLTLADTNHLEQYIKECGYNVIEITE